MLSAKCVKIHGMKDERWTIRDKIHQYRGVLKLHARHKKTKIAEASKAKKKLAKDFKDLVTDVKEYRAIANDVSSGDKRRMHTILKDHKDFQLAYENLNPQVVEAAVFEDSCLKRRQLDRLYYQKKKKMKEFFDLKLECAILSDKYEREQECPPNYVQQRLITRYQRFMARQNAAKSIRTTYCAMLKILEKDSIYYDAVLKALIDDRKSQCKVMLKATVLGQLAAENLDDTRQRYKLMGNEIWTNMKERERSLKVVRSQVQDLWAYAQSLVRVESDTNFGKACSKKEGHSTGDSDLDEQIKQLEDMFDRVKGSLAVRSYEELFTRLDAQMKHRKHLIDQFDRKVKERETLLNAKNHGLVILESLEHSTLTTTGQYKNDKRTMLEEIEIQKKREKDNKALIKSRGELLVKIRAALQNMLSMLMNVKETGVSSPTVKRVVEKKAGKTKAKDQEGATDDDDDKCKDEANVKFDVDALSLLSQVSKRINSLVRMTSGTELDSETEEKAKNLHERQIADDCSKMIFAEDEPEPTGIVVEHEIIDTSVMTRTEVKLHSRQLVEANLKPE